MTETSAFDGNRKLCDTLTKQDLPAITDALGRFDRTMDGNLRLALGEAEKCLGCTNEAITACWRLPKYIRNFGGKPPRLSLGDETPVTGAARKNTRRELLRRYDAFIKAAIECDELSVPSDMLADIDRLHDLAEALDPPDDDVRELAYELRACLECGKHYLGFCDRAHFAVARARASR